MNKEQTIEWIRARRAAHKLALGKAPRRNKRIPRPIHPVSIKAEYFKGLEALVLLPLADAAHRYLLPELSSLVEESGRERGDTALDFPFNQDSAGGRVREILRKMGEQVAKQTTPEKIAALAARIGHRTSDFQREQLFKQIKSAVGVNPLLHEPSNAARVAQFTEENVALVKSIPRKFHDDLEKRIVAGVRTGQRASELAEEIQDRLDVAASDAKRVANDQIGKFFGEMNRVRQQALGIDGYYWRGVQDNRERPEHLEREGEFFRWDDPPEGGHPGEDINCRCWAEPALEDIFEALEE